MQTNRLIPHPAHPPLAVTSIQARIVTAEGPWLRLRWRIDGASRLLIPPFAGKGRADELWRTTCFELFIRTGGCANYVELNLSPSERWAAYDFAAYRQGMAARPFPREPECTLRRGQSIAVFDAAVPMSALPQLPWQAGLCAVIEEEGGRLSYWALAHPSGRADFHDPACFALPVAAPRAP